MTKTHKSSKNIVSSIGSSINWLWSSNWEASAGNISYVLVFFLFLSIFNYINYQIQNLSIELPDIDLGLVKNPGISNKITILNLENIILRRYAQKDHGYIQNQPTIVTKPVIQWTTNLVRVRFSENKLQGNFSIDISELLKVETSLIKEFPQLGYDVWNYKGRIRMLKAFLTAVLNSLYEDVPSNTYFVHRVTSSVFITWIGVYSSFVCSIFTFLLYSLIFCKKRTIYHYLNLIVLFLFNTCNIGFVILMMVGRTKFRSGYYVLTILIFELIVLLIYFVLFFNSHKSILQHHYSIENSASINSFLSGSMFESSEKERKGVKFEQYNIHKTPKEYFQVVQNDQTRRFASAPQQETDDQIAPNKYLPLFRKQRYNL